MNSIIPIESKIYEIRGQKVMLDRDLATLYGVTTGNLNKAVKRNIDRFPADFMFRLQKEEYESLIFQTGISNQRGGSRYMPYAFTEQGVAMLSSVLKSESAIKVNIRIMRAFVTMRQAAERLTANDNRLSQIERNFSELKQDLEEIFADYNDINEDTRKQIDLLWQTIASLQIDKSLQSSSKTTIGFNTK